MICQIEFQVKMENNSSSSCHKHRVIKLELNPIATQHHAIKRNMRQMVHIARIIRKCGLDVILSPRWITDFKYCITMSHIVHESHPNETNPRQFRSTIKIKV